MYAVLIRCFKVRCLDSPPLDRAHYSQLLHTSSFPPLCFPTMGAGVAEADTAQAKGIVKAVFTHGLPLGFQVFWPPPSKLIIKRRAHPWSSLLSFVTASLLARDPLLPFPASLTPKSATHATGPAGTVQSLGRPEWTEGCVAVVPLADRSGVGGGSPVQRRRSAPAPWNPNP